MQRLAEQLASLDVPTPPLPGAHVAPAGRRRGGRDLAARRRSRAAHRTRARGAHQPRPALAQAGALLAAQSRPRGPAVAALLPLHLADSPLSRTSSATAPCWPRSAGARTRRPPPGSRRRGYGRPTREREAMEIERDADDVVRCFLLEREVFELGRDTAFDGEVVGLIGAGGVRRVRRGLRGAAARAAPARRLVGAQRARHDSPWDQDRRRDPARRSGRAYRSGASTHRAAGSTSIR